MPLPLSGQISMSQVRAEVSRTTGPINLNDADVRSLAAKASGTIKMSDLYGKSASLGTVVVDIGFLSINTSEGKIFGPERRGYWTRTYFQEGAVVDQAAAQSLSISPADYQMLYDDGLVDIEPNEFFTATASNAIMPMAVPAGTANSGGTLTPDTLGQYKILTFVEQHVDSGVTSFRFILEVEGHTVPASWFSRIEVLSEAGVLMTTLHRSQAIESGARRTVDWVTPLIHSTTWEWNIQKGDVFPTAGIRHMRFYP